jgi:hypothetical protein
MSHLLTTIASFLCKGGLANGFVSFTIISKQEVLLAEQAGPKFSVYIQGDDPCDMFWQ